MSFMVVNTGRAASRAFYLNLKAQPGVSVYPRYGFDRVAQAFLGRGKTGPLERMAASIRRLGLVAGDDPPLGVVFHGVRPVLHNPPGDPGNEAFLSAVRDQLGIDTVFLVVRDLEGLFLSDLNRGLAQRAGDWSFARAGLRWESPFTRVDLVEASGWSGEPWVSSLPPRPDLDLEASKMQSLTGKMFSIFQLFRSVFPSVYLISYERFVEQPRAIFDRIGELSGFRFENASLVDTRLNALANRLLVYNPISLSLSPRPPRHRTRLRNPRLRWLWAAARRARNPAGRLRWGPRTSGVGGRVAQFRFEVLEAIELCDDWGQYERTGIDCSARLPAVSSELGASIGLGASADNLTLLRPSDRALARSASLHEELVDQLAPLFSTYYERMTQYYRDHVYVDELPQAAYDRFVLENGSHHERLRQIMEDDPDHVL